MMSLYIDGQLVVEEYAPGTVAYSTSSMWNVIGAVDYGNGQNFNGIIDEVRIYSRALNASEVMDHYLSYFPSPPANLQAYGTGSSIVLNWEPPLYTGGSTITNYRIYRGTASGTETLLTTLGNVSTYTDTGVAVGTTYYYYVTAVNAVGESNRSNEVSATVLPPQPPSPPRNLTGYSYNATACLKWEEPANTGNAQITNYRIYRGTTPSTETLYAITGNVLAYTDTNVTTGNTYYYKVTAVNTAGESDFSNEVSVNVVAPAAPSPPRNLAAYSGNNKAVLSWDVPASDGGSPIKGYDIYRSTIAGSEVFYASGGNITTYTDTNVSINTMYYYKVKAVNWFGVSDFSNEAGVFIQGPSVPAPPRNLRIEQVNHALKLVWEVPVTDGGSQITNYRIYRATASGMEQPLVVIGNTTTYTDMNLSVGVRYYYQVSAINAIGEGNKSNEANEVCAVLPSQPRNLTATYDTTANAVRLNWESPADTGGTSITAYKIYRGYYSGTWSYITSVSALGYVDTNIAQGQRYYYVVSAVNTVGEGNKSNEVKVLTGKTPGEPRFLTASANDKNITLTWIPPADTGYFPIINYRIYRGNATNTSMLIAEIGNITSYTDMNLPSGRYYYRVSAVNEVGEGSMSESADAQITGVPTPPRNLTASPDIGKIVLRWEKPENDGGSQILKYRIYRALQEGNWGEVYVEVNGSVLSYTDTGVSGGVRYWYVISALNAYGESEKSNVVNASAVSVPGQVGYLEAKGKNASIELSWAEPADNGGSAITVYRIYRGLSETNFTKIAEVNTTNYVDKNLKNGVRYYYRVSAVNDAGEGQGAVVSAVPFTVPGTVKNLRVVSSLIFISISWEPGDNGGSNITGYRIYRYADGEDEKLIAELASNETTYTDMNVTGGKTYHYRVSAVNDAGEGPKSAEVSAVVDTGEGIVTACLLGMIAAVVAVIIVVVLVVYLLLRKKKAPQKPDANTEKKF